MEIRTPVLTLKGLRPGPLDDGGNLGGRLCDPLVYRSIIPGEPVNQSFPTKQGRAMLLAFGFGTLVEKRHEVHLGTVNQQPAPSTRRLGSRMPVRVALNKGIKSRVPSDINTAKSKRPGISSVPSISNICVVMRAGYSTTLA